MENDKQLDLIFMALADRKRRHIIDELCEQACSVGDIAKKCNLRMSATSKHLRILEQAGILYKTKQGRTVYCHMNFDVWKIVAHHIERQAKFWNNRLDELERHLMKV